jgi:hypothetical protein
MLVKLPLSLIFHPVVSPNLNPLLVRPPLAKRAALLPKMLLFPHAWEKMNCLLVSESFSVPYPIITFTCQLDHVCSTFLTACCARFQYLLFCFQELSKVSDGTDVSLCTFLLTSLLTLAFLPVHPTYMYLGLPTYPTTPMHYLPTELPLCTTYLHTYPYALPTYLPLCTTYPPTSMHYLPTYPYALPTHLPLCTTYPPTPMHYLPTYPYALPTHLPLCIPPTHPTHLPLCTHLPTLRIPGSTRRKRGST